jgi:hypothetical protein
MSDQDSNKQQNQGTQQDDWKKKDANQQGGQSGQQQGQTGQQKNPQSDRDQYNKDQQKKQA